MKIMVLGFKKQFVAPILAGTKLHSIREDQHNRWHAGLLIHMATGTRSRDYACFKETKCFSVQIIKIVYNGLQWQVFIDGRQLSVAELRMLAIGDGFKSIQEFAEWFNKDFTGKVIHWTDLRY